MLKKINHQVTLSFIFIILVTFHPFFLWGKINLFELGLYLPGINSILSGEVPFRDFFCLRGPLDLYIPAALMKIFGAHVAVLSTYFYLGTILTLVLAFLIARECLSKKIFLFSLLPVLVARTFPRVVFTYWGGMRYAWGLFGIYLLVRFCKTQKKGYLLATGVMTAIAGFTSIDIGVGVFCSVLSVLALTFFCENRKLNFIYKNFSVFFGGIFLVTLPIIAYLFSQGAIEPFYLTVKEVLWVASRMSGTIPQGDAVPQGLLEYFLAWINPSHNNFKHMTPFYCYFFLFFFFTTRFKKKSFSAIDKSILGVGVYGLILYLSSFRNIGAANFEMALQVEKIILFFLLENFFFFYKKKSSSKKILLPFLIVIIGSSWGYSLDRYNKRFFAMKWLRKTLRGQDTNTLRPLEGEKTMRLNLKRMKHMVVPFKQGEDIKLLNNFFSTHTKLGEPIFMFPELGTMHFIINRPSIGRFPHVTLSWYSDQWHKEVMKNLNNIQPQFAVINKEMPDYFDIVYFPVESSKRKFDAIMQYIKNNYILKHSTPSYNIYSLKIKE